MSKSLRLIKPCTLRFRTDLPIYPHSEHPTTGSKRVHQAVIHTNKTHPRTSNSTQSWASQTSCDPQSLNIFNMCHGLSTFSRLLPKAATSQESIISHSFQMFSRLNEFILSKIHSPFNQLWLSRSISQLFSAIHQMPHFQQLGSTLSVTSVYLDLRRAERNNRSTFIIPKSQDMITQIL